jgi:uncharacterized protein YkwD/uncharacterized membrane protein required for colicin V production
MVDVLAIAVLALLAVRGWIRGLVREAFDLAGLVLGIALAFRLGTLVGGLVEAMSNIGPDAAHLIGGLVVLMAVAVGSGLLARAIQSRMGLPGLSVLIRSGGAGLAVASGVFLVTVVLSLAVILPLPPDLAAQVERSAVTRALTDASGVPQKVFGALAGDRVVESLLNLHELVGQRQVVIEGDQTITLPSVDPGDLDEAPGYAAEVFDLLNRARVDGGLDPLAWSPALAAVAEKHAAEMYQDGYFSHTSPATGTVADRLAAAGIPFLVAGENLALAATATEIHEGLMDSPGHRENMLRSQFRRAGVAVISGPLGLMTVQVFTG